MSATSGDGRFSFLLWRAIGILMSPPGPEPQISPWLRGVVRPAPGSARIVLSPDERHAPGLAVDYPLDAAQGLNVAAVLDHVRFAVGPQVSALLDRSAVPDRDSYGNTIVPADELDFDNSAELTRWDQNIFSLFTTFLGASIPFFEEDFAFFGFMFVGSNTCRIYIRSAQTRLTYGIDLPLTRADGAPFEGYAYLARELAPLVRIGDLDLYRVEGAADEYCGQVVDLNAWFGPAASAQ
ncbi:hypothetical protein ACFYTQ_18945 [Nocardia sp. NPDC004068]|uniref:hypothetical protein n=1 Tax=Nocardia sp. NPDC004068 TaxID=3364303 RepID=UPI0036ABEBCF